MKILVIDDEEIIRSLATKILQRDNHDVLTAISGEEGVGLIETHDDIDCVVLDLSLPGMSGLETLAKIRNVRNDLPCLLSSGQPLADDALAPDLQTNTAFLEKPYRSRMLSEAIDDLLS